ncbi:PREDICTED: uncharacterized protein LOC109127299 [Camelina sativa]|uniref:Uncharacterized protein LOC109127299 n=1 Tax=Camelina sativa TaxID=90675 RepID=A0ABM1QKZ7_CAMSA|nr:PREDICTED: uncharacterized protein LOC109127299 [Camelina sativa]
MTNPSSQAVCDEAAAFDKWKMLSDIEERYLKQKAKLHWLKVGDQNNKAFHTAATIRESCNSIREIQCDDGRVVTTQNQLKQETANYFQGFLNLRPEHYTSWSQEDLEAVLDFKCAASDKCLLTHEVSKEEIRRVLFTMPNSKSLGPDEFTAEFFKASWGIIHEDFVVAIQSFFRTGFLPKGVN